MNKGHSRNNFPSILVYIGREHVVSEPLYIHIVGNDLAEFSNKWYLIISVLIVECSAKNNNILVNFVQKKIDILYKINYSVVIYGGYSIYIYILYPSMFQGRAHKWCTPVDPHIWSGKSRTTSSNMHSAAMWGYGISQRRWTIGRNSERGHVMMMMMMMFVTISLGGFVADQMRYYLENAQYLW